MLDWGLDENPCFGGEQPPLKVGFVSHFFRCILALGLEMQTGDLSKQFILLASLLKTFLFNVGLIWLATAEATFALWIFWLSKMNPS